MVQGTVAKESLPPFFLKKKNTMKTALRLLML